MVRSTVVVRASDALPLAASVDDEQVRHLILENNVRLTVALRQNNLSQSINNSPNSSLDVSHLTQNHVVRLKAELTHYSASLVGTPEWLVDFLRPVTS
jgi:hypothetical protein